jgi:hypothetical protein
MFRLSGDRNIGDDGQLNLPSGGRAQLPGRGQRDYFLWLPSTAEARTYPPICMAIGLRT